MKGYFALIFLLLLTTINSLKFVDIVDNNGNFKQVIQTTNGESLIFIDSSNAVSYCSVSMDIDKCNKVKKLCNTQYVGQPLYEQRFKTCVRNLAPECECMI